MENLFSILIPTYNNLEFLKLCVESIRKNSTYPHQIIIHVNEGRDGTLEWVKEQGLDYTYTPNNVGVCLSMNGMRGKVKTDYILYVNDDMYALPGWDEELWKEVQSLPNKYFYLSATMIQPKMIHPCSITANYGLSVSTFEEERLLREYSTLPMHDWQGATWPPSLVHRDLWDLVGGYSIEFSPGMASDPDFSAKLWTIGVRYFKGLSKSRFYHFESKTTKRIAINRGNYTFLLKWGMTYSTFRRSITRLGDVFQEENIGKVNKKHFLRNRIRSRIKSILIFLFRKSNELWFDFTQEKEK